MNSPDRSALAVVHYSLKVVTASVLCLGLAGLFGWCTGLSEFHTVFRRLGTMQPLTTVAFLFAGFSLYLWQAPLERDRIRLARICAAAVASIGVYSLIYHVMYWRFGLNLHAFTDAKWLGEVFAPGRQVAFTTAISFTLAGIALFFIDTGSTNKTNLIEWLVLTQSMLPYAVLLGYLYGVDGLKAPFGSSSSPARMAFFTSIGLLTLGYGILALRPECGWMSRFISSTPEGVILRRLLPAAVVMLIGIGVTAEFGRRYRFYGYRVGAASVTALSIVVFAILINRCARALADLECSRRKTEADLKTSEERLRMALDAANVGTWEWNFITQHIWWSEAISDLLHVPRDWFDGRFESFLTLVHPEDREMVQTRVRRCIERAEDSYRIEFRSVGPDAMIRYMAARGEITFDQNGAPVRMAGTMMDVTERKLLERELIEASNREQRRLGQDLHDDLGQWLTAIHLEARALSMFLKPISDGGTARAEKIVNWMGEALDRTRMLARGMMPAVIEAGGLSAALLELSVRTERMFHAQCHYICDDGLLIHNPEVSLQLYRIAQEAISNALRHGSASEIVLRVDKLENGRACLCIRDNGKGIPYPLPKGSGLGLRTMRYRAELLGADIEFCALREGGTEVVCRFNVEFSAETAMSRLDSFVFTPMAKN